MLNHRVKGWDKNYDLNIPTPVNVKNSVGTNKLSGAYKALYQVMSLFLDLNHVPKPEQSCFANFKFAKQIQQNLNL
jgi:hypothetical protein